MLSIQSLFFSSCNAIYWILLFSFLSLLVFKIDLCAQTIYLFDHFWQLCSSYSFLFSFSLSSSFSSLNLHLNHVLFTHVDFMTSQRHVKVMKLTMKHLMKYYKQMKAELNILTFIQRVFKMSNENLQSWVKNLWYR